MSPRPARRAPAALGGVLLLFWLALHAGANAADPAAPPSGSAVPPASASATAAPDGGAGPPRFDAEPFGEEKKPPPSAAEWKPTQPVALTDPLPSGCRAYRLREWVKIRCSPVPTSSIALLGGAREGVAMFLDPPQWEGGTPPGGEVMFPVRRGDRRMFEWSTFGESYEGPGAPVVLFLISESWVEGEPGPTIIAR